VSLEAASAGGTLSSQWLWRPQPTASILLAVGDCTLKPSVAVLLVSGIRDAQPYRPELNNFMRQQARIVIWQGADRAA
jgi:hypothetical protein